MVSTPHQYHPGDQVNKNKNYEASSAYGVQESCTQGFGGETREKETNW